jgi:DNA (cytosine-5)-methyltransferase 1
MRALDLCAGAGGFGLGLRAAGFDALGVELDPDAVETHRANVGPCERADIAQWSPRESFPLVVAGVPCQPFSAAGAGAGTTDPRGRLFRDVLRVAREAGARVVCFENVRGILARGLSEIETALVAEGYAVTVAELNAADFGVPQYRRRVFIVARRPGVPAFVAPSPAHGPGLLAWRTLGGALGIAPTPTGAVAPCAGCGHVGTVRDAAGRGLTCGCAALPGACAPEWLDRPAPTVTTTEVKGTRATRGNGYRFNGGPDRASDALFLATGRRRVTVAEAAALQGLPGGFRLAGTVEQQYRQVGNAVPPALAAAVANSLRAMLGAGAP